MPVGLQSHAQRRRAERRRRRKSLVAILVAIGVSLLVHLLLLPMPRRWFFSEVPVALPPPLMVNLAPNRRHPAPRKRLVPPRPKPPPMGPVVDAPPTKDTRVPANARFLSEHNTHVKKETVAANPGQGALAAVPTPSAGKGRPHEAAKAHKAKAPEKGKAPKRLAKRAAGKKTGRHAEAADKHALPVASGTRLLAMNRPAPKIVKLPPVKQPAPKAPELALMPDLDQMENAVGGARADQVPGVQLGTQTWLNSRQFKYASFWNRIRSLAGQAWEPMVQEAMQEHDPHGQRYGGRARMSVVRVTLDGQGQVRAVSLARSSGAPILDQVAVQAFREVGRFPNPPPPLVGPDGTIRFEFAFILNFHPSPMAGP